MSKEDPIVNAIADDLIALADGDARKAQVLAAIYLTNEPVGFGNPVPHFGATEYAEDWS
jgi:hypothetical protein